MLGQSAPPEAVEAVRQRMGLDLPLHVRYLAWIGGVLRGDLGVSAQGGQQVTRLIADAMVVTFELTTLALLMAIAISLPLGILGATRPRSLLGRFASFWAFLGLSVPAFWFGILMILFFSVRLRVLPATGWVSPDKNLLENLRHVLLPAFTLAFVLSAPLTRYLRTSMTQEMVQDYVLTAQMKGLSSRVILARHVLRNALIPYVTAIGIQFAWLIGGAVIVEVLFALPGMGRLAVQSVFDRDYFIVQGTVLVVAIGVVLISLVIDLVYVVLDPRVRLGRTSNG
jgi:peptide/nickel transport system permease protein